MKRKWMKKIKDIAEELKEKFKENQNFLLQESDLKCFFYSKFLADKNISSIYEIHTEVGYGKRKHKDLVIYKKGKFKKFGGDEDRGKEILHIEFKYISNDKLRLKSRDSDFKKKVEELERQLNELTYIVFFDCGGDKEIKREIKENRKEVLEKKFNGKKVIYLWQSTTKVHIL